MKHDFDKKILIKRFDEILLIGAAFDYLLCYVLPELENFFKLMLRFFYHIFPDVESLEMVYLMLRMAFGECSFSQFQPGQCVISGSFPGEIAKLYLNIEYKNIARLVCHICEFSR